MHPLLGTAAWEALNGSPAVLTPVLLCSVLLAALTYERFRAFHRARRNLAACAEEFVNLKRGLRPDWAKIQELTLGHPSPFANLLTKTLQWAGRPIDFLREALRSTARRELSALNLGTDWLFTIGRVGTLLGLLCAVFLLISTFSASGQDGPEKPQQLATGIANGLAPTAGGALIAILGELLGRLFSHRLKKLAGDMDALLEDVPEKVSLLDQPESAQQFTRARVGERPAGDEAEPPQAAQARKECRATLEALVKAYRAGEKGEPPGLLEAGRLSVEYIARRLALGDKRGPAVQTIAGQLAACASESVDVPSLVRCWESYRLLAKEQGLHLAEVERPGPADAMPYGHFPAGWALLLVRVNKDTPREHYALLPGLEERCKDAFREALRNGLSRPACVEQCQALVREYRQLKRQRTRLAPTGAQRGQEARKKATGLPASTEESLGPPASAASGNGTH